MACCMVGLHDPLSNPTRGNGGASSTPLVDPPLDLIVVTERSMCKMTVTREWCGGVPRSAWSRAGSRLHSLYPNHDI